MSLSRRITLIATWLWLTVPVQAVEPLKIVTDPWPPYSIELDRGASGMDVDIIRAVFDEMERDVEIEFLPWKRCLLLVQEKKVDAILDASITQERKAFMHFPSEPVSEGVTVFYTHKDTPVRFDSLDELDEMKAGAILGYSYCDELDNTVFMKNAIRNNSLRQNFNMLLAGRLDFVVAVDVVGAAVAKDMGVWDRLQMVPNALYCKGGNYLAFSKREGHEALAQTFGDALARFKQTAEYLEILRNYGAAPAD